MSQSKILAPDDLRRILKRAAQKEVTWQEIDRVKDHIAEMEARIIQLQDRYDDLLDRAIERDEARE